MIRSELITLISEQTPEFAETAEACVRQFFETITRQLEKGGRVELRDFGSFTTRAREAKIGRNPKSGTAVVVSAKRVVHFKTGKTLRATVDASAKRSG